MIGFDIGLILLSLSGWGYLFLNRPELAILSFGIALVYAVWRRRNLRWA